MAEQKKKPIQKERVYQIIIGVMGGVIVLLFFMAARTSYLLDEARSITYNGPQATSTERKAEPEQKFETVTLSGTGKKVTEQVGLASGGYKVTLTHTGESNFIVRMLNEKGVDTGSSLVNEIGPIDASQAINVPDGKYFFNVEADGDWTIKIEKL